MKKRITFDLPYKTVLIYWVFGCLWILFSDAALGLFVQNLETYQSLQTYKGWFFIIVTGLLLYPVVAPRFYQVRNLSETLALRNEELEERIREIHEQHVFIEEIYNGSNTAIVVWGFDFKAIKINQQFTEVFGYGEEIFVFSAWDEPLHQRRGSASAFNKGLSLKDIVEQLNGKVTSLQVESVMFSKTGEEKIMDWNHHLIQDPHTNQPLVVSFGLDRTLEKKQEAHIFRLGYYDKLTQLGNSYKFEMELESLVRIGKPFYLIVIQLEDLQRFTSIYGHRFGELLLVRFSELLREHMEGASLYRWQTQSFVAQCYGTCFADLKERLKVLSEAMPRTLRLGDIDVQLSYSAGVAEYPANGETALELIQNLHFALRHASVIGGQTIAIFDPQIKREAEYELELEQQLERALENDELEVYFQPIVSCETKEINSLEVLLRWFTNRQRSNSVGALIAIAEKSGQVFKIDRWVIDKVFQICASNALLWNQLTININLSAQSFNSEDLLPYLQEKVAQYRINPNRVMFELTEHSVIDEPSKSLVTMNAIKSMGFRLALDDFGTKYSSLNYLSLMPFDSLKIDKSYTDELLKDNNHMIIIDEIIRLANRLGLETVAEGIEEMAQAEQLLTMGCQYLQGYLFHKPMSLEHIKTLLNHSKEGDKHEII